MIDKSFECSNCGETTPLDDDGFADFDTIRNGTFVECCHCRSEFVIELHQIDMNWEFEVGDWIEHIDEGGEYQVSGRLLSHDNQEYAYLIVHHSDTRGGNVMEYGAKDIVEEFYEPLVRE